MADVRTVIDVDLNTSQATAKLRQLQKELNSFALGLNKGNILQAGTIKQTQQELSDLVNQSRFFTGETVRMRTAASRLDSTLSRGSATMGQFLGARFQKNSYAAAQVMGLANERARIMQTQFVATSAAAGGFQNALAIRPLAAFNSAVAVSTQKLAIQRAMFRQATTSMINFGKNVQWAGRQLMVGFTVPLTIFGAVAGKAFRDLEKEAVNFRKVYGDAFTPEGETEKMLDEVKGLSKEFTKYGIAAQKTMQLAAIAAQAGQQGADLIAATREATRLSTLGDMEQQEAMRTTIALQSAFKLSSEDLSESINYLNFVENSTVLSLQDLAGAIPRVAPVIVGLGGNVREMAIFLTAMREGGVSAAEAANGLKSSLGRLITPSRQAKEMAEGFGISLENIVQTNRGDLLGTIMDLANAMKSLGDLEKQQLLSTVFGKFQFARIGALFENITREGSQANRLIQEIGVSTQQLSQTADKELSAIENSIGTKFTKAMEDLKIAIAPIGELFVKLSIPIIKFLGKIAEAFNNLPDFAKNFIAGGVAITGIFIPAVVMIFGLLANLGGQLLKMGGTLAMFVRGLGSGGLRGAVEAVRQSFQYMSLAELDTIQASQQLATSTGIVNRALLDQVLRSEGASAAILELGSIYDLASAKARNFAAAQQSALFVPGRAMAISKYAGARTGGIRRNTGGTIPGFGPNKDTVPAVLTPGEYVVNREATRQNLDLLQAINDGRVQGFNGGGIPGAGPGLFASRIQQARQLRSQMARQEEQSKQLQKTHLYFSGKRRNVSYGDIDPRIGGSQVDDIKQLAKLGFPVEQLDDKYLLFPFNKDLIKGIKGSRIRSMIGEMDPGLDILGPAFKRANVSQPKLIENLLRNIDDRTTYYDFGSNALGTVIKSSLGGTRVQGLPSQLRLGTKSSMQEKFPNEVAIAMSRPGQQVPVGNAGAYFVSRDGKLFVGTPGGKEMMTAGTRGQRLNKGGGVARPGRTFYGNILNAFKGSRNLARAAYGSKYPPMFSPAIPGTRMYGFGEGARQPMLRGAPGEQTTVLNLIKKAMADPRLGDRGQFRFKINGQEVVANRLNKRSLDRLQSGSPGKMSFETRPITNEQEQQLLNQWIASGRPGRGDEDIAFANWMREMGYKQNRNRMFYKPAMIDPNEMVRGEVLIPRSAMGMNKGGMIPGLQYFQGGSKKPVAPVALLDAPLDPSNFKTIAQGWAVHNAAVMNGLGIPSNTILKILEATGFNLKNANLANARNELYTILGNKEILTDTYKLNKTQANYIATKVSTVETRPESLRSHGMQGKLDFNKAATLLKSHGLIDKNYYVPRNVHMSHFKDVAIDVQRRAARSGQSIPGTRIGYLGQVTLQPGKENITYSRKKIPGPALSARAFALQIRRLAANQGGMIPGYNQGGNVMDGFISGRLFDSSRKNYVPGVGDKDTVPAALTPGEFVINKNATRQNLPLLKAINDGVANFNAGGMIPNLQYFGLNMPQRVVQESVKTANAGKWNKKIAEYTLKDAQRYGIPKDTGSGEFGYSVYQARARELSKASGTRVIAMQDGNLRIDFSDPITYKAYMDKFYPDIKPHTEITLYRGLRQGEVPFVTTGIPGEETRWVKNFAGSYWTTNPTMAGNFAAGMGGRSGQVGVLKLRVSELEKITGRKYIPGPRGSGWEAYEEDVIINYLNVPNSIKSRATVAGVKKGPATIKADEGGKRDSNFFSLQQKQGTKDEAFTYTFNSGNIVPGFGPNKDSVPAVLTPGEFVINRESTQKNLDLLRAINNGQMASMNVGGQVIPIQGFNKGSRVEQIYDKKTGKPSGYVAYGDDGQRIGFFKSKSQAKAALKPPNTMGGMRGMGASMGLSMGGMGVMMVGEQMKARAAERGEVSGGGEIASSFGLIAMMASGLLFLKAPLALAIAAIAALGGTIAGLVIATKKGNKSLATYYSQIFGSAEKTNKIAKDMGRQTASQQIGLLQGLKTGQTTEEAISSSQQFVRETESGKQLVEDIKAVQKAGGDAVEALRNQLTRLIVSGLISKEEANAIALEIGSQLNDQRLSFQVNAEINNLIGTDGQKLKADKILDILAEITPKLDARELEIQSEKAFEKIQNRQVIDFSQGFGFEQIGDGFQALAANFGYVNKMQIEIEAYSYLIANAAETEREVRAQVELQLKNGVITAQEYLNTINKINSSITTGSKYFDQFINLQAKAFNTSEEQFKKSQPEPLAYDPAGVGIVTSAAVEAMASSEAMKENVDQQEIAAKQEIIKESQIKSFKEYAKSINMSNDEISMLISLSKEFSTEEDAFGESKFLQGLMSGKYSSSSLNVFTDSLAALGTEYADFNEETKRFEIQEGALDKLGITQEEFDTVMSQMGLIEKYPTLQKKQIDLFISKSGDFNPEELNKDLAEIERIPSQIIKALEINVDGMSEEEIDALAKKSPALLEQWEALKRADSRIDLNAFIKTNSLDEKGNPISLEETAKRIKAANKAIEDLSKSDGKSVKTATIQYAESIAGNENVKGEGVWDLINKHVKDFNNLKFEDKIAMITVAVQYLGELSDLQEIISSSTPEAYDGFSESVSRINQIRSEMAKKLQDLGIGAGIDSNKDDKDGGGGQKSLFQQLKENAKEAQDVFNKLSAAVNEKGFKKFIAGPFAPEFLEYLRSQGKEGLKILEGGLKKIKEAYDLYLKQRTLDLASESLLVVPALQMQQREERLGQKFEQNLADRGMNQDQINAIREIITNEKLLEIQRLERKKKNKKATEEELKQLARYKKMINDVSKISSEMVSEAMFSEGIKDLTTSTEELRKQAGLIKLPGFDEEMAKAAVGFGLSMNSPIEKINQFKQAWKASKEAALDALGPEGIKKYIRELTSELNDVNKEIAMIEIVEPLEKEMRGLEKQNEAFSRRIELLERTKEPIQNEIDRINEIIDLRQREIELLNRRIEPLEEDKERLEEVYQSQIEALDKISQKEDLLFRKRQGQMNVAQALSRGDVAGAAQAALTARQDMASARREQTRQDLESRHKENIKQIDNQINEIRKQTEAIEKQIRDYQDQTYNLTLQLKPIDDEIKNLKLQQRDLQDQIYNLQLRINFETDRLNEKFSNAADRLANLRDRARELKEELEKAAAAAARIGTGQALSVASSAPGFTQVINPMTGRPPDVGAPPSAEERRTYENYGLEHPYDWSAQTWKEHFDFQSQWYGYGGKVKKMGYGGRVSYKGSRELPPGMAFGGMFKKYANGSLIPGMGNTDRVPAMLMPGEYVVNKSATAQFLPLLQAMNESKFPSFLNPSNFMFDVPSARSTSLKPNNNSSKTIFAPSNYTYDLTVNVPNSNSSPDEIANAVIGKIKMMENKNVRSVRI